VIHLVNSENKHLYKNEMRDQFRVRHEIYVEERKWEALRAPDRLERDQFDTDDAAYILALDNGRVVGGSRFSPTDKPHLLGEIFPHLADVRGVPRGPDIAEWTRFYAVRDRRATWQGGGTVGQILCGGIEYLLSEGFSAFTFIFEAWFLGRIHDMGWKLSPLGLPAVIENGWWLAAQVPIDQQTLQSTRKFCGVSGSVLAREGVEMLRRSKRTA